MPDFSHHDLVPVHLLLAFVGTLCTISIMVLSSGGKIAAGEKGCLRQMRRVGMFIIGAGFLWSMAFGLDNNWQPWPPMLLIMAGCDLYMLTSIISAHVRRPSADGKLTPVSNTGVGNDPYSVARTRVAGGAVYGVPRQNTGQWMGR